MRLLERVERLETKVDQLREEVAGILKALETAEKAEPAGKTGKAEPAAKAQSATRKKK